VQRLEVITTTVYNDAEVVSRLVRHDFGRQNRDIIDIDLSN